MLGAGAGRGVEPANDRDKWLVYTRLPRHNGGMPEQPTKANLEKAHLILSEFGLLIGPAGEMSDIIARAVAAGIALGRKEALAVARKDRSTGQAQRT